MRKITILGSTGSIGTQTLDVVRENKDITVVGISAGKISGCWNSRSVNFRPGWPWSGTRRMPGRCRRPSVTFR